jgi:hypothetical protein
MTAKEFPDDVVRDAMAHMNTDHAEEALVIVQAHGAREATAAALSGFDSHNTVWTVMGPEGPIDELHIPWPSGVVSDRRQIRGEIVSLYKASCTALGVKPKGH